MHTDAVVALISKIRDRAHALIMEELDNRGHPGLAPSHGAILVRLFERGPLSMSVLANEIDRRKNTVTTLVKKLEVLGYVRRESSMEDTRVVMVALTPRGEAFRLDFAAISSKLLHTVWGDMDDAEKRRLMNDLETILGNLC